MTDDRTAATARIPRQRRPPDPETLQEATGNPPTKKTKTDLAIEEAAARLVADAPPLSPQTRARLAELLSVTHRHRKR
jgi:hypothetical protein